MRLTAIFLAAALLASPVYAAIIIPGTHSDYDPVHGLISDVRLEAELEVEDGHATWTFINVSLWPETGAVFKEIVLDTFDDDTGTAIFWSPVVLTDTKDVSYTVEQSNGLPGYHDFTSDPMPLVEFAARPSPVKRGIGPGEVLSVRFSTILPDGSGTDDYLQAFGGGEDTGAYTVGFHAISADVVGGQSLSGINVPEPAALAMLLAGVAAIARRRRSPASR